MSKGNGFVEEQDMELSFVTDPAHGQLNVQQDPYVRRQTRINLREIINETTRKFAALFSSYFYTCLNLYSHRQKHVVTLTLVFG